MRSRWTRRRRLAVTLSVVVLLIVAGGLAISALPEEDQEPTGPPNVLVIMTDDQRAEGTLVVMPQTQSYFRDGGLEFTSAYATTPMCCPSRATVFTGRYTHNHGLLKDAERNRGALDQDTTIQAVLSEQGYETAIYGKYLNRWDLSEDPPHFDSWAIFANSRDAGYTGGTWNVDGAVRRVRQYSTSYIRRRAQSFIQEHSSQDQPWVMFLHPAAPHVPSTPEERYKDAPVPDDWVSRWEHMDQVESTKPDLIKRLSFGDGLLKVQRRLHLRTLMSVDDLVGGVMQELSETGQARNTLVVFLSDNGFMWGEHGLTRKLLPYEGAARIPLMLRWPGRVPEGEKDGRLAATIDIAPTIYDAIDVDPSERPGLDGRSLLRSWDRDRLLLENWAAYGRPGWAATRTHRDLYVEYHRKGAVVARELYDLVEDPLEQHNLLSGTDPSAADVQRRSELLHRDQQCAGRTCP